MSVVYITQYMKFLGTIYLISLSVSAFSQTDSIYYSDSVIYHQYKPGFFDAEFLQFHGYAGISGEAYFLNLDFFEELITKDGIPTVELQQGGYLIWMALMREKIFYSISFSFADKKYEKIDTLSIESRLRQNTLALRTGYNLIAKEWVVISPYLGFRTFRFKHLTGDLDSQIPFVDYVQDPNIDLRVTQFSAVGGLNVTFSYNKFLSFGFYIEYLQDLHRSPIVRTKGTRLNTDISSPIDNLLIGIGMGFH